jgi:hypothetical protein
MLNIACYLLAVLLLLAFTHLGRILWPLHYSLG